MLNNITLMGRLTRVPELRATQTGKFVTSFTIAVDRDYARQQTDFIDCVAWGGTAEFVNNYFAKGQMIALNGRLQMRDWKDKHGNSRVSAEVVADHVYFCGDKPNTAGKPVDVAPGSGFTEYDGEDNGELPF